jgi:hypothetical protein
MRNTFTARTIKLARAAGALSGVAFDVAAERNPEQQTAYAAFIGECTKRNADPAAAYAAASQADNVPAPKPEAAAKPNGKRAEQPKAEKPSKPSDADAKRSADYDARVKLIAELAGIVSGIYNGPSLAVRRNPKRIAVSVYAELLKQPKHRTDLARISERDESALMLILKRGTKTGGFDPVALNLDSGIFSRLASVSFIAADGDGFTLTADALKHARGVARRASTKQAA